MGGGEEHSELTYKFNHLKNANRESNIPGLI